MSAPSATESQDERHRWSRWDHGVFARIQAGPMSALQQVFQSEPDCERVVQAYDLLVREGLKLGEIRKGSGIFGTADTLLQQVLLVSLPALLPSLPPNERIRAMTDSWNVCERVLRQPAWMVAYLMERMRTVTGIRDLAGFFSTEMRALTAEGQPSQWKGAPRLVVLDTKVLDVEFLPGILRLAAPGVVALRDRERDASIGIVLRGLQQSTLWGPIRDFPDSYDDVDRPQVTATADGIFVNGTPVPLAGLGRLYSWLVVSSGFLVAVAIDSQRVWVLETEDNTRR